MDRLGTCSDLLDFRAMIDSIQQRTHITRLQGRGEDKMTRITDLVLKLKIWKDQHGQDLIEYALMAGFVAVAAGAIMPNVASSISTIFSKINSVMATASTQS